MEYKAYNVSSIEAVLLLDILETQKEILQELKRINPEPQSIPEEIPVNKVADRLKIMYQRLKK